MGDWPQGVIRRSQKTGWRIMLRQSTRRSGAMIRFGKVRLVAAALLLIAAPLCAVAEDAAAPPAAQSPDDIGAQDLISPRDAVGEEARRREQEARDNARQALDALTQWLLMEMTSGRFAPRTFDSQAWFRNIARAKQAIDAGNVAEANEIAKQMANDIGREEEQEARAGHRPGGCGSEAHALPEGEGTTDEAKNVRSKLLRAGGRLRGFLEVARSE